MWSGSSLDWTWQMSLDQPALQVFYMTLEVLETNSNGKEIQETQCFSCGPVTYPFPEFQFKFW